jgi:hypothetical protein
MKPQISLPDSAERGYIVLDQPQRPELSNAAAGLRHSRAPMMTQASSYSPSITPKLSHMENPHTITIRWQISHVQTGRFLLKPPVHVRAL